MAAALRRQREELLAAINAQGQQLRDEAAQQTQAVEQRLAALEAQRLEGGGAATVLGAIRASPSAVAPVVSAAPAPGEAAVFWRGGPTDCRVAAGAGRARRGDRPPGRGHGGGAAAGAGAGPDRNSRPDAAAGAGSLGQSHPAGAAAVAPAGLGARAWRAPPGGMAAAPAPGAHLGLVVSGTAAEWEPHARKHLAREGRNPLPPAGRSRNTEDVVRLCQVFPP